MPDAEYGGSQPPGMFHSFVEGLTGILNSVNSALITGAQEGNQATLDVLKAGTTQFDRLGKEISTLSQNVERIGNIGMAFNPSGSGPFDEVIRASRGVRGAMEDTSQSLHKSQTAVQRNQLAAQGFNPDEVGAVNFFVHEENRRLQEQNAAKAKAAYMRSLKAEEEEKKKQTSPKSKRRTSTYGKQAIRRKKYTRRK